MYVSEWMNEVVGINNSFCFGLKFFVYSVLMWCSFVCFGGVGVGVVVRVDVKCVGGEWVVEVVIVVVGWLVSYVYGCFL